MAAHGPVSADADVDLWAKRELLPASRPLKASPAYESGLFPPAPVTDAALAVRAEVSVDIEAKWDLFASVNLFRPVSQV